MLNPNIDDLSNSDEVGNDQSLETQDSSQSTEQPVGQGSDSFTQIDRSSMSAEMQETFDNMNRDYTQTKQQLADERRQLDAMRTNADLGQLVSENPVINKLVYEAVGRLQSGQPIDNPFGETANQQSQQSRPASNMSEEEIAGRALVREEARLAALDAMKEFMPSIMQPLNQVSQYVRQNQAQTEYDVLCQKYPNAKSVSPMALQSTQLKYQRADGTPISLEEAFVMNARANPSLLTAQPNQSPSQGVAVKTSRPVVEQGGAGSGATTSLVPSKTLYARIKELASAQRKEGSSSLSEATARSQDRFLREHPESAR